MKLNAWILKSYRHCEMTTAETLWRVVIQSFSFQKAFFVVVLMIKYHELSVRRRRISRLIFIKPIKCWMSWRNFSKFEMLLR